MAADEHFVIPVICGPTAAGKSAIALWLADRMKATIVVADSRQIYRRFDIGTAKPSAEEQALVPHRGIDVIEPVQRYSGAAWAEDANRWITESRSSHRPPLVVGGTGFYLRAFFEPLFEEPQLDSDRRRELEGVFASMSFDELGRWCRVLDPERAHLGRTQLQRAIEVAVLTGQRLSALHRDLARPARRSARYLVVDPGPALADRIATRLDAMLARGWVEEVTRLMTEIPENAPAWKASGYRVVAEYVRGGISRDDMRERILIETRRYAKRQRTWFRHQLDERAVTRLDPAHPSWREIAEEWFHQAARRPT